MTKKELTQQYKNAVLPMGIFQIRNIVNGKIYLETSTNLDKIWNRHRTELRFAKHENQSLQADWNLHGEANFVYEILAELSQEIDKTAAQNKQELKLLEKMYLDELQSLGENGYNYCNCLE